VAPVGLGIKVGTQLITGDSTTEEVWKQIAAATKIHQFAEYKIRFTDKSEEDREWAFDSVPDFNTTLTEQVRHLNSKNPEGCANRYVLVHNTFCYVFFHTCPFIISSMFPCM